MDKWVKLGTSLHLGKEQQNHRIGVRARRITNRAATKIHRIGMWFSWEQRQKIWEEIWKRMSRCRKDKLARREDNRGRRSTKYQQLDHDDQQRPWLDEESRKKKLRGNKTRVSHCPGPNSFLWTVERILWTQLSDSGYFRVRVFTILATLECVFSRFWLLQSACFHDFGYFRVCVFTISATLECVFSRFWLLQSVFPWTFLAPVWYSFSFIWRNIILCFVGNPEGRAPSARPSSR
jgi:hypothetical protein